MKSTQLAFHLISTRAFNKKILRTRNFNSVQTTNKRIAMQLNTKRKFKSQPKSY